jgi:hypothetical protein
MRDTDYATELAMAEDGHGQRIERLHIKAYDRPEIRFSWWPGGAMAPRPLDLPEDELLSLMGLAFDNAVFSSAFEAGLLMIIAQRVQARAQGVQAR